MQVRPGVIALVFVTAAVLLHEGTVRAQNLPFVLFERYLEPLRVSSGIPGLSAAIYQDGQPVWEIGLGLRDLEANHAATAATPYLIGDLTQPLTAMLVLYCADRGLLHLDDSIGMWAPTVAAPGATLRELLTHQSPGSANGFRYDPGRYSHLARPIESCFKQPFRRAIAGEVFDQLGMTTAVPGYDIGNVPNELRQLFDESRLQTYAAVLQQLAVPYKVDRRARATRNTVTVTGVDGASGLIASVRDLAKFDGALWTHLRPETLQQAWSNATHNGQPTPFGLGWFVQNYNGEKLVWHFGYVPDAYSSLILKVPSRRLTLILLANSDGLSAPFSLHQGDITSSLFARTFLRLFL
jgi:CubicO group peptidase (beta-lactamase class C family)